MPEVQTLDSRGHQVSSTNRHSNRVPLTHPLKKRWLDDEWRPHLMETAVAFLIVFALGLGVGYSLRAQVSRKRRRRGAERHGY